MYMHIYIYIFIYVHTSMRCYLNEAVSHSTNSYTHAPTTHLVCNFVKSSNMRIYAPTDSLFIWNTCGTHRTIFLTGCTTAYRVSDEDGTRWRVFVQM